MSRTVEQKFGRAFDALKAADLVEVTDEALDLLRSEGQRLRVSVCDCPAPGLALDMVDIGPVGEAA
jgi:hypothetical protein